MTNKNIQRQFTAKIIDKIKELFDEEQFNKDLEQYGTEFIHAIGNLVPTVVYNELMEENFTTLDFNHLANKLIFQESNLV